MVDQIELTTTINNNNGTAEWTSRFEKWSIVWDDTRSLFATDDAAADVDAGDVRRTPCFVCDSYQSK